MTTSNYNFKLKKAKNLAYCIIDKTSTYQSGWAREISVNLSDQFIFVCQDNGYDVFVGQDEDQLLKDISRDNFYTHAVVVAAGTSLGLNCKLFSAVESFCREDTFSLAGHILDRKEHYYELHHQFFIVNLKDYRIAGCPDIGQEKQGVTQTKFVEPIRSQESYHDDYVPLWIKTGKEAKMYSGARHGYNIIEQFLEHNFRIIDIGEKIRNNKFYLYYEHDHVFLRELERLQGNQFFGRLFVPAENTDKTHAVVKPFINHYVTVGTGYNWIKNLCSLSFDDQTKVTFVDMNPNCLAFMKELVTEWDGVDYQAFYKNFILSRVPQGGDPYVAQQYINSVNNDNWNKFKSQFNNWESLWHKIRNLKYNFVNADFLGRYQLDWITPGESTVVNVSDLFTYSPPAFSHSLKYRIACENRLINRLRDIDPSIFLVFASRAADGFRTEGAVYRDEVGRFDLTDINSLIKPTWHEHDWTSPVMLG